MAAYGETSFNSYTFTYKWTINDLGVRSSNPRKLTSPVFTSPPGVQPATKWKLIIFNRDHKLRPPVPASERCLSVELQRQDNSTKSEATISDQFTGLTPFLTPTWASIFQKRKKNHGDVWVEANLKHSTSLSLAKADGEDKGTSQGPTRLRLPKSKASRARDDDCTNVISFQRFLPLSKVRGSRSVIFLCEIKVWSLDKPIHVINPSPCTPNSTNKLEFDLSKCVEEARQNNLFTDVTLVVADQKEFKAHKVVLASQSQFFKTRFASRWMDHRLHVPGYSDDRVEMTDVPASVMEAILSYMYTGKVANIEKIANNLLPAADEYGLIGLRKMCEEELCKSLTSGTAIPLLIHAVTHSAPDLKKACIEFITLNTASVRQSEWWGKLKEAQMYRDLWVELLENIAEKTYAKS